MNALMPLVYDEIIKIAVPHFRDESRSHTLEGAAIVNEVYLKLLQYAPSRIENRKHFYAIAARSVRQVLVDYLKRSRAAKRGAEFRRITLDGSRISDPTNVVSQIDLLTLHECIEKLETLHVRQARLADLRLFSGLNLEESAEALGVSARTIDTDWKMARAWLVRELSRAG